MVEDTNKKIIGLEEGVYELFIQEFKESGFASINDFLLMLICELRKTNSQDERERLNEEETDLEIKNIWNALENHFPHKTPTIIDSIVSFNILHPHRAKRIAEELNIALDEETGFYIPGKRKQS